jgi:hypothetical protein
MSSCRECCWWTQDWKDLPADEGVCMIARTETGSDGVPRSVIADALMRAVGNDGHVAGWLFTHSAFACAQFERR